MNITGIIVEYNPLHKGHVYHLTLSREVTQADAVIAVMSGNFVQRGQPALIDKWNRAEMALLCGVDLVIELPVLYSLSSAEFFAFGAVSLLHQLGAVNHVFFGSESGSIELLQLAAEILTEEPEALRSILKEYLSKGLTYPAARAQAVKDFLLSSAHPLAEELYAALASPNNILGIEYCKSLLSIGSSIQPHTMERKGGAYHHEHLDPLFSSATALRKHLKLEKNPDALKNHLPDATFSTLSSLYKKDYPLVYEESMLPFLKYKEMVCKHQLEQLPDASEGLHNKISKALQQSPSYSELVAQIKSKRYTQTRITRILTQFFIGFEDYAVEELRKKSCPYARVLGFNGKGAQVLKLMKETSTIPILTKLPQQVSPVLQLEIQATKAYSLLNQAVSPMEDYLHSPVRMD